MPGMPLPPITATHRELATGVSRHRVGWWAFWAEVYLFLQTKCLLRTRVLP
jgi:hypothetical protein